MTIKNRIDVRLPNRHAMVIGASGSGKSSWIKRCETVRSASRLLIWDPDEEYTIPHAKTLQQARAVASRAGFGPLRLGVTLQPTRDAFEWFCRLAFSLCHAAAPLVVIVEELADVAGSGKASPAWGELVRKGRKYGAILVAASQRPQEIDKTIFSQVENHWCGRLRTDADRRYMSQTIGVPVEDLQTLGPCEYFLKSGFAPAVREKVKF